MIIRNARQQPSFITYVIFPLFAGPVDSSLPVTADTSLHNITGVGLCIICTFQIQIQPIYIYVSAEKDILAVYVATFVYFQLKANVN